MLFRLCSQLLLLSALVGCGSGSSNAPASAPPSSGTIVATRASAGTVATTINGGTQTVSISFNSTDSRAVDQLRVTGGLASLPAGWQGPTSFNCTAITTGSGCLLNLTYAPTAVDTGTLTLAYEYSNAGAQPVAATIAIPYQATAQNNVVGTVSPSGQISAVVASGAQAVAVTFTTDDGNAASALTVSSLDALPLGWSVAAEDFTCATVSSGNGCQLQLDFSPASAGNGVLSLGYDYRDNSGSAKSGRVDIAFASSTNNNVVGTTNASGPVTAIVGSNRDVAVTFTTDDGNSARNFTVTTDLTALPAGWTSGSDDVACETVDTGSGCQLLLSFAPSAAGSGTLMLQYSYQDNSRQQKTGSLNVAYAGTTTNAVVGHAAPAGQVNATLGGSQLVVLTFTTDDGLSATNFAINSGLDVLPGGWTHSAGNASCSVVSIGNGCQLQLTYAPTAVGNGTLPLGYSYLDNSGISRTGTLNVTFSATANNNAATTVSPSGQVAVTAGASEGVTITFTSDDGNALTGLTVTTDLQSLPPGWSSAVSTFNCASVVSGNGCELDLTYAPSGAASGTTQINFSYVNHAGVTRNGSVNVPYVAYGPHLFMASAGQGIYRCPINLDGSLSACVLSLNVGRSGMTFVGNQAYASTFANNGLIDLCNVEITGSFSGCVQMGTAFSNIIPYSLVRSGDYVHVAYIEPGETYMYRYSVAADGVLSNPQSTAHYNFYANDLEVANNRLYITNSQFNGTYVLVCSLSATGTFTSCATALGGLAVPQDVFIEGNRAWITTRTDNSVWTCDVSAADGTFSNCIVTATALTTLGQITIYNNRAYLISSAGISICDVAANGTLANCRASGQTTAGKSLHVR